MIARTGAINIWHWAHKASAACDYFPDHETPWHLEWKALWPAACVEVAVEKWGRRHIADVLTPDGLVIEFQHSPIRPDAIFEREVFYGRMIWVIDLIEPYESDRLNIRDRGDYQTFRWRHARKHLALSNRPQFWDLGDEQMFALKKMHAGSPCGGWGRLLPKARFTTFYGPDDLLPCTGGAMLAAHDERIETSC